LEKLDFEELIVGPAHVKHAGCPLLGNHVVHELAIVMKMNAPRKVVHAYSFGAQSIQGGMFGQEQIQCLFVLCARDNGISRMQHAHQKMARVFTEPNKAKSQIGKKGSVSQSAVSIILDEQIKGWVQFQDGIQGIFMEPNNVHVLKQNIISQPIDQLHGHNLGVH
jgi:hypothetical protein